MALKRGCNGIIRIIRIISGHAESEIKVQTEKGKWNHNLGHG